ncbi:hypothetical protein SGPA1_12663 [Streptomyces misionensis JCM 4497]
MLRRLRRRRRGGAGRAGRVDVRGDGHRRPAAVPPAVSRAVPAAPTPRPGGLRRNPAATMAG